MKAVVWYTIIPLIVCYTSSAAITTWNGTQSHYTSYVYGTAFSHTSSVLYSSISYVSSMGCNYIMYIHYSKSHQHSYFSSTESNITVLWDNLKTWIDTKSLLCQYHGMESQTNSSQGTLTPLLASSLAKNTITADTFTQWYMQGWYYSTVRTKFSGTAHISTLSGM